jgi:hypothetical protein
MARCHLELLQLFIQVWIATFVQPWSLLIAFARLLKVFLIVPSLLISWISLLIFSFLNQLSFKTSLIIF